jgi:hypothetical protein
MNFKNEIKKIAIFACFVALVLIANKFDPYSKAHKEQLIKESKMIIAVPNSEIKTITSYNEIGRAWVDCTYVLKTKKLLNPDEKHYEIGDYFKKELTRLGWQLTYEATFNLKTKQNDLEFKKGKYKLHLSYDMKSYPYSYYISLRWNGAGA